MTWPCAGLDAKALLSKHAEGVYGMVFPYTRQGAEPRRWAERMLVTCLGEFLTGASRNASVRTVNSRISMQPGLSYALPTHPSAVLTGRSGRCSMLTSFFSCGPHQPLQPFRGCYPCRSFSKRDRLERPVIPLGV